MTTAPVVEKRYQLILWMLPKLAKFPRDQHFLLADRIERCLLDILNGSATQVMLSYSHR